MHNCLNIGEDSILSSPPPSRKGTRPAKRKQPFARGSETSPSDVSLCKKGTTIAQWIRPTVKIGRADAENECALLRVCSTAEASTGRLECRFISTGIRRTARVRRVPRCVHALAVRLLFSSRVRFSSVSSLGLCGAVPFEREREKKTSQSRERFD